MLKKYLKDNGNSEFAIDIFIKIMDKVYDDEQGFLLLQSYQYQKMLKHKERESNKRKQMVFDFLNFIPNKMLREKKSNNHFEHILITQIADVIGEPRPVFDDKISYVEILETAMEHVSSKSQTENLTIILGKYKEDK